MENVKKVNEHAENSFAFISHSNHLIGVWSSWWSEIENHFSIICPVFIIQCFAYLGKRNFGHQKIYSDFNYYVLQISFYFHVVLHNKKYAKIGNKTAW